MKLSNHTVTVKTILFFPIPLNFLLVLNVGDMQLRFERNRGTISLRLNERILNLDLKAEPLVENHDRRQFGFLRR